MDKIIRAMDVNGKIRVFGAVTTSLVQEAVRIHDTSPVVTAALGRCLTANCMMGVMLKGEKETVSVQLKGDGPLGVIVTVGNSKGEVRGYVGNNSVELPLKANGKLDVGNAVGKGYLTIIKDLGMKEPYISRVELQTGEIAEDLTYHFAFSEQVPSVVALGVLVDRDWSVRAAGGYIIQLMPYASEEDIRQVENNIQNIASVTTLMDEGKSMEEILAAAMNGFELTITNTIEPAYKCNCNRERLRGVVASLGKKEIEDIIEKEGKAELACYFCNSKYEFSRQELNDILRNA